MLAVAGRALLVDGDEVAVPREVDEEVARARAPLEKHVAALRLLQEISQLQPAGPAANDAVVELVPADFSVVQSDAAAAGTVDRGGRRRHAARSGGGEQLEERHCCHGRG